jgi:hypothetical protein
LKRRKNRESWIDEKKVMRKKKWKKSWSRTLTEIEMAEQHKSKTEKRMRKRKKRKKRKLRSRTSEATHAPV